MKVVLLLVLCFVHNYCLAINVVFVNPSVPGTPFWDRVTAVAKAAAQDLSINLEVVYGEDNRISNLEVIEELAARKNKPAYVIFMPFDGTAERMFGSLNASKIPFITVERTLQISEQQKIGFPGEIFEYWIGEVFHDNEYAGNLLAERLIAEAKKHNPEQNLVAIGISGSFSGESSDRTRGLERAIADHKEVQLAQVVPAIWSRERSRHIIHQLTSRFGKIDVAWAASDGMALGILDSVKSGHGTNINKDMKIGGIDWTGEGIDRIRAGELTASVGGHFMQTAWALVKIYDQEHGKTIFKGGDMGRTYDLEIIDRSNIHLYGILSKKVDWTKVDFKNFTLTHTKSPQYNFSFEKMIRALY
ncbi:ABC transporter substrate-binding protein [Thalassotalea marina]|uniref:Sugar ABC transporter substrate-binding protein n=1 Tax=Thalassotalea marina TaxID=1673741 RepID=A0A919ELF7_9GAMM|nr:ABC transporter substrate-binding protein [Thalassotalea marina]GHF91728.1 sugar ABC transporter substrate-binding protein [Thalassotalea marina]